jgi:hypothetical protein
LDADEAALRELDAFVVDLLDGRAARLSSPEGLLVVEPESRLRRDALRHRPRLELLRADPASRLGDDATAMGLASSAVLACARCEREWQAAGLVALRAGERVRAERWLRGPESREPPLHLQVMSETTRRLEGEIARATGPLRVQLEAERLSTLGLPGRALSVLRPHREEIALGGASALESYALVAVRAGDDAEATSALAQTGIDAVQIEGTLARWRRELGRSDAPIGNDERELERAIGSLLAEEASVSRATTSPEG